MGASNYPGLAIPKPEPRWKAKDRKAKDEAKTVKTVFELVDQRDQKTCRICRKRCGGIGLLYAVHHHHIVSKRTAPKAIKHTTANICSLCNDCHDKVENSGLLRVTGDADARDAIGVLCGLTVERAGDGVWEVVGQR